VIFKARQMLMQFKERYALKIVSRTIVFIKLLDTFFNSKAVALLLKNTRSDDIKELAGFHKKPKVNKYFSLRRIIAQKHKIFVPSKK
jgi:hypothetical protein